MKLAAPRTIRSVADAFLAYQEEIGINSVIDLFNWEGVLPQQVYYAVLERLPEVIDVAVPGPQFRARELFHMALHSDEFQNNILRLLLNAFDDKRRLFFIHIPKCAGVDLTNNLAERHPYLYSGLAEREWTSKETLFRVMRDFTAAAHNADSLFIGGHLSLAEMLEKQLYRFGDEIFTVVRDPVERVISKVNYVVEILRHRTDPLRPDRLGWLETLGYERLGRRAPRAQLVEVAQHVLRNGAIVGPDAMCNALGLGDCESSIEAIARSNIEITDIARYDAWLNARWGIDRSAKLNASAKILQRENLSPQDLDYIKAITSEDLRLYGSILRELNDVSEPSIRGVSLGRRRIWPKAAAA